MEIEALVGMAFAFLMTVTLIVSVGAVILLKPLMRNLGNFLEAKAEEKRLLGSRSPEDWDRLFGTLEGLGDRLKALEERQDFTEKLLARPPSREEGG
jgi:hypothetical protein